jgi:two-component system chemotaxis sensor kinase CheA
MDELLSQVLPVFAAEVQEQVARMTTALLKSEAEPELQAQEIEAFFRQAHNLKGSAAALGIGGLAALAHSMESALLGVRRKQQALTHDLVDCELRAMDAIQQRMAGLLAGTSDGASAVVRSIAQLDQMTELAATARAAASVTTSDAPSASSAVAASVGLVNAGVPLASAWEELEFVRVSAEGLDELAWQIEKLRPVVESLRRAASEVAQAVDATGALAAVEDRDEAKLDTTKAQAVGELQRNLGTLHRDLLRDVQSIATLEHDLTGQLRELRLVSAESLVPRLQRTLRESCRLSGHEAQLVFHCEQVVLDRALLAALSHPLLHLIRNAVDHGIESPEIREAIGKPRQGTVEISVHQHDEQLDICVADDGRGIDPTEVRRRAVSGHFVTEAEAAALDDRGIHALLLRSGFSTAEKVTELSGRGVGLDVVSTVITALAGQLEISSTLGSGCCFRLTIPLGH